MRHLYRAKLCVFWEPSSGSLRLAYCFSVAYTVEFVAELWEYGGAASWFFVTLPEEQADEIADRAQKTPGFGAVKVNVAVGSSRWSTSLFPSTELGSYVLPMKRAVRDREGLAPGDAVSVVITLSVN